MDLGKLEQAIRENPASPEAYLVYGDGLESQGDPRGELIAVELELAREPTDALLAREVELLALHERTWLGDALYEERRADRLACEWRFGFLRAVTMYAPSPELFAALRDCPVAKFLELLTIDTRANPNNERVPHPHEIVATCRVVCLEQRRPNAVVDDVLRRQAEAAMAAVVGDLEAWNTWNTPEQRDFRSMDDRQYDTNPHNPWQLAKEELARLDFLPYLVEQLAAGGDHAKWARYAFVHLGPAADIATDALRESQSWYELYCVAPDHAKALGVHRRPPMRDQICAHLSYQAPHAYARHIAPALASDDVETLRWAVDANGNSDRSYLERVTRGRPRCVPAELLRRLLDHPVQDIRDHAASRLVEMRFPEDADRVIGAILEDRVRPHADYTAWLGSHPKSDGLLALTANERDIAQIKRRRRCAGLSTEVEDLHDANKVLTLERADDQFLGGAVDNRGSTWDALGAYARVLLEDPRCAPAAFRIAWIERGFGAKITDQRIAWLRGLGVSENALAMLARRPPEIVPGMGYGASRFEPDPVRAAAALAAGLPSLAYWYFPEGSAEGAAAREAAKSQLPTLC